MRCEAALLEPAVLIQLFHARRHSLQLPPALRAVQSLAKNIRPPQHAIADILFDPIPPSVSTESNALILGTGPLRRLGVLSTSFLIYVSGIAAHAFCNTSNSWSLVFSDVGRARRRRSRSDDAFSIGFMSALCPTHGNTFSPNVCFHALATLDIWQGARSF